MAIGTNIGTNKVRFSSIECACNYPLGTMNPIDSEVQIIVIDALQYELVCDVDASGLKIIADGSGFTFTGRLVVVLADGSVVHHDGKHRRSDFVARYGFGLFTIDEMVDHETRTFADDYNAIRTELDGGTVRRLNELR